MPDLVLDFTSSYCLAYRDAIVARLRASAKIPAGIQILGKVEGTLESAIEAALSAIGITVFVSPPLPAGISPDIGAVVFDQAKFVVRIIVNDSTDDTGMTAHLLMEIILARLHHFTPPGIPGAGIITPDPDPVDPRATTKKRTIFDIEFSGSGNFGLDDSLAEGSDD